MRTMLVLAALLAGCTTSSMIAPTGPVLSMEEILSAAPQEDWRTLQQDRLLYLTLPSGRVVIELTPAFAPEHVANVRALAAAHYWDGGAITRVQDNYVVQWAGREGGADRGSARPDIPEPEYERAAAGLAFTRLPDPDTYAPQTGFSEGFPVAGDGAGLIWPAHCYGMVGVGREMPPNTGDGSELYAVIGQSPRHLDRNLAIVGRVVLGMELFTSLKRGTGALGFYETPAERTPLLSVRLGSDLPESEQVQLQALRTDSASFATLLEARRWRRDEFFVNPTGRINLCNVPLPVRAAPES